ncbi:MAG: TetR/AcrR family transcriptional regulator [Perlucidibaca sp.]
MRPTLPVGASGRDTGCVTSVNGDGPLQPKEPARTMSRNTAPSEFPAARQAIIQAALTSFSQHGINGVSLRSIVSAAGQQNQSAIHYHFGNKPGLVSAVLSYVSGLLADDMSSSIAEFRSRPVAEWTPATLTELICRPFILLDNQGGDGRLAIKFMSRLTWQEGGHGQALLVEAVQPYFSQFIPALAYLNPSKPVDMLTFQFYLAVNTLIHGLADSSLLTQSPARGVEKIRSQKPDQMIRYFVAYISGGLFSEVVESS